MSLVSRLSDLLGTIGLDVKALFIRAVPAGGTTGQVLTKASATDFEVNWQTPNGAASLLSGVATITVPDLALEDDEVIVVSGVTPANRCFLSLAPHNDTDENHETWTDLAGLTGVCGAGSIAVNIRFREPSSGPFKIQYMVI